MNLTAFYAQLTQKGAIPFVDYMHQVLYAPSFGYYSGGLPKLGAQGDFITAPELTPLFGKTLAKQCYQVLSRLEKPNLFEFGAGSGQLCVDLMQQLDALSCLPDNYFILEISHNLRHRQRTRIEEMIPHLANRIHWLDHFPNVPFNGVVVANEVLDAMPVHRFLQTEKGLLESYVAFENDKLVEMFKPEVNPRLAAYLESVLPKTLYPYQSEANLFVEGWLQSCYDMLHEGVVLLIDYGFPRHEYYHPDRHMGTLMCHYRHHTHPNPLLHPSKQDITAHVDFTQVAEAADKAGFQIQGYTNLASFLLANGLLSLLEDLTDNQQQLAAKQAVKQLLLPNEMGELFKVIALTKQLDIHLQGFSWQDKRASL